MHNFKRIFAVIIGLVFLFSGCVKLMDPVGSGLVFDSYLVWMHLDWLRPASKYLSEIMSAVEAFTGLALLAGIWRRLTAIFTVCLVLFFTLVSAALVIFNPSMDCGCFGELVHLSHLQTLLKNVVLCLLCFFAFTPVWDLGLSYRMRGPVFGICSAMIVAFAAYSWYTIPYLDFTDYQPSHTLVEEEDLDASELNKTFFIWDADGNDCSWQLMEGDVALVTVYSPDKLSDSRRNSLARFCASARNNGFTPYVVSTSQLDVPGVESLIADYKSIITMNRSNGGVTLLDNGNIYSKRSINNLYTDNTLAELYDSDKTEFYVTESTRHAIVMQAVSAAFLLLLVLF
ncbi:MAG: DoxX family protein [Bacteroidales bacterium]|nr:DoxX family protein [Bacteroidales bacterium]